MSQPKSTTVEEFTNDDQTRVIKVTTGRINLWQWGMNLPESEKTEFIRIVTAHEDFVSAAEKAGDVAKTRVGNDVTLVWKNFDIHCKWIATMSEQDHEKYLDYWRRYRQEVDIDS